ncbi:MAG: 1-deoxy-D-xylulose-5-phosphate synthase [Veillonella sp.]|uniref:1-deoxy-D-xylulose-5-phosphate synthase n=1 Tax=Veillonella TaxID=29465 RepID=UPI002907F701|nr:MULTISPECIES: 1-deoxy-D-xylulose-5-phosphate synthase [Veillonella]MDU3887145.1 1-deoxy-D-xylulose-5-phosphate synthase [Veillonella sp.]MDU4112163.1 1-deoxy-D-xylulose-5-phosphate synthase [Veillonella parvula]MDU4141417.1 1-deoxy-D-xylulose-5-phosphate synthase [Veillonella parvula]MDU6902578.1 1-deoxy-D-xylulose-5-phosphate synthase [Veillonella sp.]
MKLSQIHSADDLKQCTEAELVEIAREIRDVIIHRTSIQGGHVGPSLGATDIILALHYVFNCPDDKIIFDISHQSYAHKILTNRLEGFMEENKFCTVSGYSNPCESNCDLFHLGHASTALSLACGLVIGRDLNQTKENIIALIGDGALSGGEAFEALNHLATMQSNCIVIINDNDQSIAENHGGLYKHLKELRDTNRTCTNNIFKALGFDYRYIEEGNSVLSLIAEFKSVINYPRPIILHIRTTKGFGYKAAEMAPEDFHNPSSFDVKTGTVNKNHDNTYESIVAKELITQLEINKSACIITAATPGGFCLTPEIRQKLGAQYIDVGIAEEHAMTLLAGIARANAKPILPIYSTFLQRAYDQLINDVCINNSNALILVYRASIYGTKDITHLGFSDIPMLTNIPNLTYIAPTTAEELQASIQFGLQHHDYPIAIRVPVGALNHKPLGSQGITDVSIRSWETVQEGREIAIVGVGNFYRRALALTEAIKAKYAITPTVIKPLLISELDIALLDRLQKNHSLIITLEDGVIDGGFGQKIAAYYGRHNLKVMNYGIQKGFYDRYNPDELLRDNHMGIDQILQDIMTTAPSIDTFIAGR